MNSLETTGQLIKIPSYLSKTTNESEKGKYILNLLASKRKDLIIIRQRVMGDRFNIVVKDRNPITLLLAAHIDTVEPKSTRSLIPKIEKGRLSGLGSVDMLSGVASLLSLLLNNKTKGVMVLFYVDEEYDFLGMRKFVEEFKEVSAQLCIIPEPTNLKICRAHRGLIEAEYVIRGKTGHTARPEEGINAITETVKAVNRLKKKLKAYHHQEIGVTSCTLAQITGGLDTGSKNNKLVLSSGSNSIPDICRVRLDVRPATKDLNSDKVFRILDQEVKRTGCKITYQKTYWDLGSLFVDVKYLKKVETAIKSIGRRVSYVSPNKMGYGDGQMIFEKLGIPTVYFGVGPTERCHQKDEYVNISDLELLDKFLIKISNLYR